LPLEQQSKVNIMPLFNAILGILLLFFGRSLYWAFVAIAGFLVGVELADVMLTDKSQLLHLLVAFAAGVLGALLAMLVQRVGFALGGLYAGGYLAMNVARAAGNSDARLFWFCIGGAIGALCAIFLMDWAIIVLSSFVGAATIITLFDLEPLISAILFIACVAVGIVVQGIRLRYRMVTSEHPT
jgi:hypothetical protein